MNKFTLGSLLEKTRTKTQRLLFVFALVLISQVSWGQTVLAGWDFSTLTNYGASPQAASTTGSNVTIGGLTRGSGIASLSGAAAAAWGGNDFRIAASTFTTAVTDSEFATFTVKANTGATLSLSSISAYNIRRSGTGPATGRWQYSVNGTTFTDIGTDITWGGTTSAAGNTQAAITLSGISALQNLTSSTTVTFRVVLWGASGAAGTWYLNNFGTPTTNNDFIVNGTVKTTPTLTTAPTASAITSGQTLASSTLSGGAASVAGTFAFTTPTTAPSVGTASQGVTFTPTDTTLYNTFTTTVSVTVNKANSSITTAPTASAITFGQALSASALTGGVGSPAGGSFAFTSPSIVPSAAGTASYSVTYTPTDTANYNTSTTTVSVTVDKATPTLTTAPTATSIALGQTLASSTLSGGAASVAGAFAFTTPSTAPSAGTASQGVTFTPTDTTNYNTFATTASVTVSDVTTWTTTGTPSWDYGTPTAVLNAVIDGTYGTTANGAFSAKSLTVNAAKSLTVNTGTSITVAEALVNDGTITVENNANLIQTNVTDTNSGSGTATVKRDSNPLYRLDYTLWSSPVSGQNLFAFSPLTSAKTPIRFYIYNQLSNLYVEVDPIANPFLKGRSFLIRMPNENPASLGLTTPYYLGTEAITYNGEFAGTLNNGPVSITAQVDKYYSVGNPYPSTISADAFLNGNDTDGTLYFWRKKNSAAGSAYATYTLAGGTGTGPGTGGLGNPNGTIQVGQGFIVKTGLVATSIAFSNTMRTPSIASTQFFKTKNVAAKSRIWLNLTNTKGVFSQAMIAYMDGATLGVDKGIDGKYFNDSKIALTSNVAGEEYSIQGRPAFDATDVVALNFKTDVAGDYTIALDAFDGLFASGQDVYLVDNVAGKEIDLKAGSYTFTAAAAVDNARFSLKYQKTLKVDVPAFNENNLKIYKNNGVLFVNSSSKTIKTIEVYDVQGRLIAKQMNVNATSASINNLKEVRQMLIVKVSADDNSVVSKKVLN
jgi:hypothetical protein